METIKTIEEFEKFINEHKDCAVTVSKELDEKINRNYSTNLMSPPDDFDLFFKIHGFLNTMLENNISYCVKE